MQKRRARKVFRRVILGSDLHFSIIPLPEVYKSSPQVFWHQGLASWKTVVPWSGTGAEMILGFFEHITFTEHHHPSSTSDRQALDACKECATETPRMCRSQWSLLFCENSAADLPGGRVQVVIQAVGNGCEHRWGLAQSATTYLLPCSPVPTRPQAGARVSGPLATG